MRKNRFRIYMNAPITIGFAAICILALCLSYLTDEKSTALLFSTYHSSLLDPLTYIRLICHVFGHISINHLVSNMLYILLLGPMLEEKYTAPVLIEVIAVTAVITGLINYVFFWQYALCGASGVVFAFILMSSFTSFKEGEIPLTFILVAVFYIGQQIVQGIAINDNVSNMAHIIGGVVGGAMGYALNRKKRS